MNYGLFDLLAMPKNERKIRLVSILSSILFNFKNKIKGNVYRKSHFRGGKQGCGFLFFFYPKQFGEINRNLQNAESAFCVPPKSFSKNFI